MVYTYQTYLQISCTGVNKLTMGVLQNILEFFVFLFENISPCVDLRGT